MKIHVEFENLEELRSFCEDVTGKNLTSISQGSEPKTQELAPPKPAEKKPPRKRGSRKKVAPVEFAPADLMDVSAARPLMIRVPKDADGKPGELVFPDELVASAKENPDLLTGTVYVENGVSKTPKQRADAKLPPVVQIPEATFNLWFDKVMAGEPLNDVAAPSDDPVAALDAGDDDLFAEIDTPQEDKPTLTREDVAAKIRELVKISKDEAKKLVRDIVGAVPLSDIPEGKFQELYDAVDKRIAELDRL